MKRDPPKRLLRYNLVDQQGRQNHLIALPGFREVNTVVLTINQPRPYFAELPYYLWGEVNYDSEGNCRRPTDREWTALSLRNRETGEVVEIARKDSQFTIESEVPHLAVPAALLLVERSAAQGELPDTGVWSLADALARTQRVQAEFPRAELKAFDSHYFWGSWKWVGWYATDLARAGRWIMNALLARDTRAVYLCVEWMKSGPAFPEQSVALRYALALLTHLEFKTDAQWIGWYEKTGRALFPEPDFDVWLADLKRA